jgi:hypothetical protein
VANAKSEKAPCHEVFDPSFEDSRRTPEPRERHADASFAGVGHPTPGSKREAERSHHGSA